MRNRLRFVTMGLLSTAMMSIGSALAWADDGSIVLDLVRHGESIDNAKGIIDTVPPGTQLDATGEGQATAVATAIQNEYTNIAGIYASDEIRSEETATPLAQDLNMYPLDPSHILSGLNEIPAGSFEGDSTTSLEGILYLLGPLSWVFGDVLMPDIGDPSVNGVTFDESFGGAVQTIYGDTVGGAGTSVNDVAFSSEGAIAVWTLMNVNNPDFSVLLQEIEQTGSFLPNAGQVVVEGSPGDWTLVSYDGIAVPQDPGLGTDLFVDFRNLIEAPQFAGYDIYEALLGGNSGTIDAALQTGINQVDTALSQFPVEVFDQIVAALGGSI
jgi:Histidine phosphatase superfamily (branch 1)